jgi:hypothetical protein
MMLGVPDAVQRKSGAPLIRDPGFFVAFVPK